LTGTDVVLSGEFIVLSDGEDFVPNMTTVTIPSYKKTFRLPRSRQIVTVQIPEETIIVPEFEVINSQFGFVLEQTDESSYTATVKLLTDTDVSQIPQNLDDSRVVFMNASTIAQKNAWHKAVARVSNGEAAVEVYNDNGTMLENITKSTADSGVGELEILMNYRAGQFVVFKNLKVETVSQTPKATSDIPVEEEGIDFLYPYIRIALLLAGSVLAVVYLKGRKKYTRHPDGLRASSQNGRD
jgi:hypothetical protein